MQNVHFEINIKDSETVPVRICLFKNSILSTPHFLDLLSRPSPYPRPYHDQTLPYPLKLYSKTNIKEEPLR